MTDVRIRSDQYKQDLLEEESLDGLLVAEVRELGT